MSVDQAIDAALAQNWKEAIHLNTAILKDDENNLDALNRLAYAYLKTGQPTKAKRMYQQVLKLDPYNQIAQKYNKSAGNIKRKNINVQTTHISPILFLEEPGKTKIVQCVNPAPIQILSTLSPGQEVMLKAKNHCVEIRNEENRYLAALPDDLSFKLIKLLGAGNTYQTIIKGVSKNTLTVLIRELTRGKKFAHQPSFISALTTSYLPFAHQETKEAERPDVTPTGETEESEPTEEPPSFE